MLFFYDFRKYSNNLEDLRDVFKGCFTVDMRIEFWNILTINNGGMFF